MEDFEIPPPTPMDQLCTINELARQCYDDKLAFVCVSVAGYNHTLDVQINTDICIDVYPSGHGIMPRNWDKNEMLKADRDDVLAMQKIIDRLQEVIE